MFSNCICKCSPRYDFFAFNSLTLFLSFSSHSIFIPAISLAFLFSSSCSHSPCYLWMSSRLLLLLLLLLLGSTWLTTRFSLASKLLKIWLQIRLTRALACSLSLSACASVRLLDSWNIDCVLKANASRINEWAKKSNGQLLIGTRNSEKQHSQNVKQSHAREQKIINITGGCHTHTNIHIYTLNTMQLVKSIHLPQTSLLSLSLSSSFSLSLFLFLQHQLVPFTCFFAACNKITDTKSRILTRKYICFGARFDIWIWIWTCSDHWLNQHKTIVIIIIIWILLITRTSK